MTSTKIQCRLCKKPIELSGNKYFPFCGQRCKLADLHKWFAESYSISGKIENGDQVIDDEMIETETKK